MNTFLDIIRIPDDVKVQTEKTPLRFEEGALNPTTAKVTFKVQNNALQVILQPTAESVKRIRIRFRGDLSGVKSLYKDGFERCQTTEEMRWQTFIPQDLYPWYVLTNDGFITNGYGVKTGPNAFAHWQCDPSGITLWIDVRNGSSGISPKEPLVCVEIVSRKGMEGETPYKAAREFCKVMCPKPNLLKTPVFGFNEFYYAYGNISEETVLNDAKYIAQLCSGASHRPFRVIDSGWQGYHMNTRRTRAVYIGGPWNNCNERFTSMAKTAEDITAAGCRPGLWFRPLQTIEHIPTEAVYQSPFETKGAILDPSHPFTLEKISTDIKRFKDWGYELIKHDFTTFDILGQDNFNDSVNVRMPQMFDKTKTNAQIMRDLYIHIQKCAGDSLVMGCNTINHLTAGVHQLFRAGNDTSGHQFEMTRRHGIHSLMRLHQNNTFYNVDPDCSAFTNAVSSSLNLDFMEVTAITGATLFTSIAPGVLTSAEEQRMNDIFKMYSDLKTEDFAEPTDWMYNVVPSKFIFKGQEKTYDWYREYDGVRRFYNWYEWDHISIE